MTPKVLLLYFEGCPNVPRARKLLERLQVPFTAVDQEALSEDDPRKGYTSPTILADGQIIYGTRTSEGSGGCSISRFDEAALEKKLKK